MGTEAPGRPAIRIGQQNVLGVRPVGQHPARPFFPYQVLRQRIGKHRARRCDMDHIVATILLPQRIVGCPNVKQSHLLVAAGRGQPQQKIRG